MCEEFKPVLKRQIQTVLRQEYHHLTLLVRSAVSTACTVAYVGNTVSLSR